MTIQELKDIIDNNVEGAEAGNLQCQCQVIEAQAEIDRLEFVALQRKQEEEEDEAFLNHFCNPHDQWEEKDFFWDNDYCNFSLRYFESRFFFRQRNDKLTKKTFFNQTHRLHAVRFFAPEWTEKTFSHQTYSKSCVSGCQSTTYSARAAQVADTQRLTQQTEATGCPEYKRTIWLQPHQKNIFGSPVLWYTPPDRPHTRFPKSLSISYLWKL